MNTTLVSIYITNYNYAAFIRQSIESVLDQTSQDFELLIIDDGSTDNSKDIIATYRNHPKISIIYQQNKGLNITNNIAMRAAGGKYLMRLDADDFLAPNALEKMSTVLEQDESLGLVFPDYYYVDKNGTITGEERRHDFEKEVSLYDQPAHGACTMIRLDFLKKLGGYNESFTCQDGYDLWIKFITHYKVTNINSPLFYYRRHSTNLTNNEDRILSTRKQIKEAFVSEKFKTPETIAVIPVRDTYYGEISWPLFSVEKESVIVSKVNECLKSEKLKHIVVSSSDEDVLFHCRKVFKDIPRVVILERPKDFSKSSMSLDKTIQQAIDFFEVNKIPVEAIVMLSIEYPFLSSDMIDEAINTHVLFGSDAVLSVRPDNRVFYQHTGHTLKPILEQDKYTKLERDALYRGAGGIVLSSKKNFTENHKMLAGKVSHIIADELCAFEVNSKVTFEMYRLLISGKRN